MTSDDSPTARGPFTIDASVFLSAVNPNEPAHAASLSFLEYARRIRAPLALPTLVLPEVAAGYARSQGDSALGAALAERIARLPGVILDPLDEPAAQDAAGIAAHSRLRGSDAVYAATARRFGATLVTLDRQQRKRLPADIATRAPDEVTG
jgi:predicted nucleic acid-binding protein